MFRREVLEAIDLETIPSLGYAFQVETTYRAMRAGFRVVEVPIVFRDRRVGRVEDDRRDRRSRPRCGSRDAVRPAAQALMPRLSTAALRRDAGIEQRTTTLELFYDLVFVFAITQVSHLLLDHLTWEGAGQSLIDADGRLVGLELHDLGHQRARSRLRWRFACC